jgi:hypothetical protein
MVDLLDIYFLKTLIDVKYSLKLDITDEGKLRIHNNGKPLSDQTVIENLKNDLQIFKIDEGIINLDF